MSNKRYSFWVFGFHPEDNYIWCLDYPRLMQNSSSGYWFSPRRQLYTGFGIRGWYKILLRAIGFHPEETLYGASVIRILWKILLRPNGFHPENNYIWGIGYLSLMQDPPLRVVRSHPEATLHMGFGNLCFMQDPPSGYWSSPWSKAWLYMEMIILWSYGILFGLRYWLTFGYWCTW